LDIKFTDHLNTQLVITLNCSTVAHFLTLQLTRSHAKSFPACSVVNSSCLVKASNKGYSSAFIFKSSLNGGSLPTVSSSESESELFHDWSFTANQFVLATSPLRLTISIFFFFLLQFNSCSHGPYVTSSLIRRSACRLQLLLAFASAVILRSSYFTVSDSRPLQPGGPVPSIYSLQKCDGPIIPPRQWVPFSSPSMTPRATVEVFDPASTRSNFIFLLQFSSL
jgi:hypothetical protein